MRDIVAHYNGLTKAQYWSLQAGDVQNLLEEAIDEIERLRGDIIALRNGAVGEGHRVSVLRSAYHALTAHIDGSEGGQ